MINLSYAAFFKKLNQNRNYFIGISEELDFFISKLPNGCAGCYYRKVSHKFPKYVDNHKEEVERRASSLYKQEVKIG